MFPWSVLNLDQQLRIWCVSPSLMAGKGCGGRSSLLFWTSFDWGHQLRFSLHFSLSYLDILYESSDGVTLTKLFFVGLLYPGCVLLFFIVLASFAFVFGEDCLVVSFLVLFCLLHCLGCRIECF